MRQLKIAVAVSSTFFALAGCQKQSPPPNELLDMAIAAHGGRDNIMKPRHLHLTGVGSHSQGKSRQDEFLDWPNQWKCTTEGIQLDGTQGKQSMLLRDGKMYVRHRNGAFETRDAAESDKLRSQFGYLPALVSIKENATELTSLGTHRFLGTNYFGIEVLKQDGSRSKAYFHQESRLLGKYSADVELAPGTKWTLHFVFGDYRPVDGVIMPFRLEAFKNDERKPDMTLQLSDVQVLEKFDAEAFSMP